MKHLTRAEKDELLEAWSAEFQAGRMGEREYRMALVSIGYNATGIEELIKFYKPPEESNDL